MPDWIKTFLDLLSQFTGGRGGIDHVIVNYGIAAIFYFLLLKIAQSKNKESRQSREVLLIYGFAFGLSRELFMISLAVIQALGLVDPVKLHIVFPPLEHELLTLAMITIAAAYLRYLLNDSKITRLYLKVAVSTTLLCYLVTFLWWANYIQANPTSKFGQVWPDWVFHINASVWMLLPAIYLALKTKGTVRNLVVTALAFFFLKEFLKLPDMAMNEVYENVFTPISRVLYLIAIPLLGFVYVYEQNMERRRYLDNLEDIVKLRTTDLENAMYDLSASNEKLNELSQTDSLTGLKNRRYFDDMLALEWQRAKRDKTPISLLLIDLDKFKNINDNYGHMAGDEWLRIIADNILIAMSRVSDIGVRYGGDEFAILLPNTDKVGAMIVAQRVRKSIEQSFMEWAGDIIKSTITIGVSSVHPLDEREMDAEKIQKIVDAALYAAKDAGRNKIGYTDHGEINIVS